MDEKLRPDMPDIVRSALREAERKVRPAPASDLVLCRRVVRGDVTKYYDYEPVQDASEVMDALVKTREALNKIGDWSPEKQEQVIKDDMVLIYWRAAVFEARQAITHIDSVIGGKK